jgi:hypothetical protein
MGRPIHLALMFGRFLRDLNQLFHEVQAAGIGSSETELDVFFRESAGSAQLVTPQCASAADDHLTDQM